MYLKYDWGMSKGDKEGMNNLDKEGTSNGDKEGINRGDKEGIGNGDREGIGKGDKDGIGKVDKEGIGKGDKEGIGKGNKEGIGKGDKEGISKDKMNVKNFCLWKSFPSKLTFCGSHKNLANLKLCFFHNEHNFAYITKCRITSTMTITSTIVATTDATNNTTVDTDATAIANAAILHHYNANTVCFYYHGLYLLLLPWFLNILLFFSFTYMKSNIEHYCFLLNSH